MAQRYGEQLQALIPEIDGVVGTGAYAGIVELLDDVRAGRRPRPPRLRPEPEHDFLPRLVTTPRATAYLKIAEGCDHPCTFCIIPQLRGAFRSRGEESILAEARALGEARYERTHPHRARHVDVGARPGHPPRRLGATARAAARDRRASNGSACSISIRQPWIDELVDAMARLPKVCKYMDMPLQHAHPDVLRAMRRPGNGERYLEIVEEFRARIPGITMRSTFIVGFPGETEEHVAYLEEWIGRAELDRVGFFEYSCGRGNARRLVTGDVRQNAASVWSVCVKRSGARRSAPARGALGTTRARARGGTPRLARTRPRRRVGESRVWFGRSQGEAPGRGRRDLFHRPGRCGEFVDVTLGRRRPVRFLRKRRGQGAALRWVSISRPDDREPRAAFGWRRVALIVAAASSWRSASGVRGFSLNSSTRIRCRSSRRLRAFAAVRCSASPNLLVLGRGLDYDYNNLDEESSTNSRSDVIWAVNLDFEPSRSTSSPFRATWRV